MGEKLFGAEQALPLLPEVFELPGQHLGSARRPTMEHLPDLREAHTDALTCAHHFHASDVLVGVEAVARRGSVGDHHPLRIPMPQDVLGDSDLLGDLSDPHPHSFAA